MGRWFNVSILIGYILDNIFIVTSLLKGIMLVYDITDAKSFDNIATWLRNIGWFENEIITLIFFWNQMSMPDFLLKSDEHANEDVERMILGNKADMEDKRVVSCQIIISRSGGL